MKNIKQSLGKLLSNVNFIRATIFYGASLLIGIGGMVFIGGIVGWYFLTCFPGFGTGVALALLNNGHKKPVRFKNVLSTIIMTVLITLIVWWISGEWLPAIVGWVLAMVGGFLGLWFCRWENKRHIKKKQKEDSEKKDT